MAKKLKSFRVFLNNGLFGAIIVQADRYELMHDDFEYGYFVFFIGDREIAAFPVMGTSGVMQIAMSRGN